MHFSLETSCAEIQDLKSTHPLSARKPAEKKDVLERISHGNMVLRCHSNRPEFIEQRTKVNDVKYYISLTRASCAQFYVLPPGGGRPEKLFYKHIYGVERNWYGSVFVIKFFFVYSDSM